MPAKKNKTTEVETKSENKIAVYRYILNHSDVTKQDIFSNLGLSLPTIKQALDYLEACRMIKTSGKVRNTGGRNATTYSVAEESYHAIGIFFSSNHMSAVCLDFTGEIISFRRIRILLNLHSEEYLRKIGELVETVRQDAGVEKDSILGVGIAVPSLVSDDGESIIFGMSHDFTGVTRRVISTYIPYPTRMYHDSNAAGFSEIWRSSKNKNLIYLNLNNTVGSSIIINGKLYAGNNHLSGELGHMIVDSHSDKRCYCGQYGCFETLCSATVLDSYTHGNLEQFFTLVREGDPVACTLWDEYLNHLAVAIHNLRMLFDCTFIIGGYIGSNIDPFLQELLTKVDKYSIFTPHSEKYIQTGKYRVEATATGAALHIIDSFIEQL